MRGALEERVAELERQLAAKSSQVTVLQQALANLIRRVESLERERRENEASARTSRSQTPAPRDALPAGVSHAQSPDKGAAFIQNQAASLRSGLSVSGSGTAAGSLSARGSPSSPAKLPAPLPPPEDAEGCASRNGDVPARSASSTKGTVSGRQANGRPMSASSLGSKADSRASLTGGARSSTKQEVRPASAGRVGSGRGRGTQGPLGVVQAPRPASAAKMAGPAEALVESSRHEASSLSSQSRAPKDLRAGTWAGEQRVTRLDAVSPAPATTVRRSVGGSKDTETRRSSTRGASPPFQNALRSSGVPMDNGGLKHMVSKGRSLIVYPPTLGTQQAMHNTCFPPHTSLDLEYCHGLRGREARNCVLVNREGRIIFMAACLGVVHNLATNTQTFFRGHDAELRSICLHPNLDYVASGQAVGPVGQTPMACVWSSCTRSLVAMIGKGHFTHGLSAVGFSASGKLLATLCADPRNQLSIWNWSTGQQLALANSHSEGAVLSVLFLSERYDDDWHNLSADLCTVGKKHAKFWTLRAVEDAFGGSSSPEELPMSLKARNGAFGVYETPPFVTSCLSLAWLGLMVMGCSSGDILMWRDGRVMGQLSAVHTGAVVALLGVGRSHFISGGADGRVVYWSATGHPERIERMHSILHASVRGLAYLAPYAGAPRGLEAEAEVLSLPEQGPKMFVGRLLVVTGNNELLLICERSGEITPVLQGHREEVPALVCHRAAQIAFSGGKDGLLRVADLLTRKTLRCQHMDGGGILALALSHSNQHLACALQDGSGVVMEVEGLRVMAVWRAPEAAGLSSPNGGVSEALDGGSQGASSRRAVVVMSYSPDDSLLIAGALDGSLSLLVTDKTALGRQTASPASSPSRRLAASEGDDGGAHVQECRRIARVAGHSTACNGLDWSRCGRFVQSSGADLSLLFWEVSATNITLLSRSSLCRDVPWQTQTCLLGWGVQGVWDEGLDGAIPSSMDLSPYHDLCAVGDSYGQLSLFRFPACGPNSKKRRYAGHSAASGGVMAARFSADSGFLVSVGGEGALMQWRLLDDALDARDVTERRLGLPT